MDPQVITPLEGRHESDLVAVRRDSEGYGVRGWGDRDVHPVFRRLCSVQRSGRKHHQDKNFSHHGHLVFPWLPARVEMTPPGVNLRTMPFVVSAARTLPSGPTARLEIEPRRAWVADSPSTVIPEVPIPATLVMVPSAFTLRILKLPASAT